MPVFEYTCKKCGHKMEFLEKSKGASKHTCAQCGSLELQKLLSSFAATSSSRARGSDSCSTGTCPLS